jgi:predicted Rossmann-fold nucleotide-binding protein
LFEALTLIQTRKIRNFPIVLYGSKYWSGLLQWLRDAVLPGGKISEHDMAMFHVTDSPAEVVEIVTRSQSSFTELDHVSDDIRVAT